MVTGHLEISALNDPKMILGTKRSKVPHIYVSLLFLNTKFHSFLLYGHPFGVTGHFETSALNDLKMTWDTTRSRCPIYVLLVSLSPKSQAVSF